MDTKTAIDCLQKYADEAVEIMGKEEEMIKLARVNDHLHFKRAFYPRLLELISDKVETHLALKSLLHLNDSLRAEIFRTCADKFLKNHKEEQQ